jgi:hypothetical protein
MASIVDSLHQDHINATKLLDAMEQQLVIFGRAEVPDYEMMHGITEYFLDYPSLYHHPTEDLILRKMESRSWAAKNGFPDLHYEHQELAAMTRRFLAAIHNILQEVGSSSSIVASWWAKRCFSTSRGSVLGSLACRPSPAESKVRPGRSLIISRPGRLRPAGSDITSDPVSASYGCSAEARWPSRESPNLRHRYQKLGSLKIRRTPSLRCLFDAQDSGTAGPFHLTPCLS